GEPAVALAEAAAEGESESLQPRDLGMGLRIVGIARRAVPVALAAELKRDPVADTGEIRHPEIAIASLHRLDMLAAGTVTCLAPDAGEGKLGEGLPALAEQRGAVAVEALLSGPNFLRAPDRGIR